MEKPPKTLLSLVFLFSAVWCLLPGQASAQRYDTQRKIKRYYVKVYNETSVTKGILFEVTDSNIVMLDMKEYEKYKQRKDYKLTQVHYSDIEVVKIVRMGRFTKCLAIGAVAGAGIGFAIGTAGGANVDPDSETTKEDKVFLGTGLGLAAGVAGGFIFGIMQKSFTINKNAADFGAQRENMQKRALQNQ